MYAVIVLALLAAVSAEEKYTTKYDNVKLEELLNNDRLLSNYFDCIIGKGKCTPDGAELKKDIPDALQNGCSKCSQKQKEGVNTVLKFLDTNKPDLFKQLKEKYDPEGKYGQEYKEEAKAKGIKVE